VDRIFTASNDFTAHFTHAFGQVLDFQQWVDSHGEYARHLLPGISSPRRLLIIGRRSELTEENSRKLQRFTDNSMRIDVMTFDDLLGNAASLAEGKLLVETPSDMQVQGFCVCDWNGDGWPDLIVTRNVLAPARPDGKQDWRGTVWLYLRE
jgi:hypothetical protein